MENGAVMTRRVRIFFCSDTGPAKLESKVSLSSPLGSQALLLEICFDRFSARNLPLALDFEFEDLESRSAQTGAKRRGGEIFLIFLTILRKLSQVYLELGVIFLVLATSSHGRAGAGTAWEFY